MFEINETPECIEMVKERRNKELKLNEFMLSEKNRLAEKVDYYTPLLKNLRDLAVKSAVRKEYSNNENGIYRGYYCPSPVDDLIIGGCRRGKLLKRITKRTNPDKEYLFDSNNRLVAVNSLLDWKAVHTEVLIYEDNLVTGINIDNYDNSIIKLSECIYDSDNKIKSFLTASVSSNKATRTKIDEIELEKYSYDESGLNEAEIISYYKSCKAIKNIIKKSFEDNLALETKLDLPDCDTSYEHYIFYHDNDGFIDKYVIINPYGDEEYKALRKVKI